MANSEIAFGLKLWSNNTDWFADAISAHQDGRLDFIEIQANPAESFDLDALGTLKGIPVTIHATPAFGFHEFIIGEEQLLIWQETKKLADFFETDVIVLHPGKEHTLETFSENLRKIEDPRIRIENMAGRDIFGFPMFGQRLDDLRELRKLKPICFDLEKAVKAACHQGLDYKAYIYECLRALEPDYFHISGGKKGNSVDQHLDLWDSDFDLKWMREKISGRLVFETPKRQGLANDLKNMAYFRDV